MKKDLKKYYYNFLKVISLLGVVSFSFIRILIFNFRNFPFGSIKFHSAVYGKIDTLHYPIRIRCDGKVRLGAKSYIYSSFDSLISIGRDVNINYGAVIVSICEIRIDDNCSIAEYVTIRDQEHVFTKENGTRTNEYKTGKVYIGKNCWIGRGCYIGPGSIIGANSIVAANSVVRGVFPDNVLIAGAPAKLKRYL